MKGDGWVERRSGGLAEESLRLAWTTERFRISSSMKDVGVLVVADEEECR